MSEAQIPVLIGVGQVTEKGTPLAERSSQPELIEQACRLAMGDAGLDASRFGEIDTCVIVRSFRESTRNAPELLCARLGMGKAQQWITPHGGNAPQYLVNRFAEAIARGEKNFVLLAGAEARDTVRQFIKQGAPPDWSAPSAHDPQEITSQPPLASDYEIAYDMLLAAHVYPLFENALRHHYGASIAAHQRAMGALFARFSAAAAKSPFAWFNQPRTAEEIATATPDNRFIAWPYTKLMNAMNTINQSAALILTSQAHARALGVAAEKCVYLHGCADTNEIWNVSERVNYHSSPAIRLMGQEALRMAGKSIDEIELFDIYSCFPSAVQIACDALGIAHDDPRPLTVTGGLPYHGGAGNNYVMNSIAAMVEKLRAQRGAFGMVTANGGYLSKHSIGIYATTPIKGTWQRTDPQSYQPQIDTAPRPPRVTEASGAGVVETYTVLFDRDGAPKKSIIIGRLGKEITPQAPRFLAHSTGACLSDMVANEYVGQSGTLTQKSGKNIMRF